MLITLLSFLACSMQDDEVLAAHQINYNEQNLDVIISEIDKKCEQAMKDAQTAMDDEVLKLELSKKIANLATRIDRLELKYTDVPTEVDKRASQYITFDPRMTNLLAKDVQAALTEIAIKVKTLELKSLDMGEAGPGLFELPEGTQLKEPGSKNNKKGKQGPPPGGQAHRPYR